MFHIRISRPMPEPMFCYIPLIKIIHLQPKRICLARIILSARPWALMTVLSADCRKLIICIFAAEPYEIFHIGPISGVVAPFLVLSQLVFMVGITNYFSG